MSGRNSIASRSSMGAPRISGIPLENNSSKPLPDEEDEKIQLKQPRASAMDAHFEADDDEFRKIDGKLMTGLVLEECVQHVLRGFADMIELANSTSVD